MKISPVTSAGNTVGAVTTGLDPQVQRMDSIRSVKMNTLATPQAQVETPAGDPAAVSLTIPDTNKDAEVVDEATQPLSPQFAALAKQRRALQVKERELADREKALSTTPPGTVDLAKLKSQPLSVLLEAGVTYEQLTEAILANQSGVTPEINALKSKIKELEEGLDKKFTERDSQAEQQALAAMQREATQLVAEGDTYEMVRETKSLPTVMKLILKTYKDTGEVLDVSDALQQVEDILMEDSLKIANMKKVQSKLAPPQAPVPPQQQRQTRTLTNRDTATPPLSPKQRALAAFHGTLKR
jgi:hypothetical protein